MFAAGALAVAVDGIAFVNNLRVGGCGEDVFGNREGCDEFYLILSY
jgi:hypothetical protein